MQSNFVQGCEEEQLSNDASLPTVEYMSLRVKQIDNVGEFLRLFMRIEHIELESFEFLILERTGVVYYEAKDPRGHHRGFPTPDGSWGTLGKITPVPVVLISSVNRLRLFEIVRGHGFGAAESWLAFRRNSQLD